MCPSRAQPPLGHTPRDTRWHLHWRMSVRGCCRSSISIRLGPGPAEGEICTSSGAKCKMAVGALSPAGVQTPPALTWFLPGPATPMRLSRHPGGLTPPSPLRLMVAASFRPAVCRNVCSSRGRAWPGDRPHERWEVTSGCGGCSHRCPTMQVTRRCPTRV